jgi:diketogulonate reductase-like aldo/keto reductase
MDEVATPIRLGRSDIVVHPVALGTYLFSGTAQDLSAATADYPILVDTSSLYGTEAVVGAAAGASRGSFVVATKVFPDSYSAEKLKASAKTSLATMGLDWIDLLQLHWPSDAIPIDETIGAMEDLIDEGVIRAIGLCNFRPSEVIAAVEAARRHGVVSNQVAYSLYDRRFAYDVIPYCEAESITVVAYSPLGAQGPDFLRSRDSRRVLDRIAEREGATAAQVALAWAMRDGTAIALCKSSSPERMIENSRAACVRLTPQDRAALVSSIKPRRIRSQLEERVRLVVRRTLYSRSGQLNGRGRVVENSRDLLRRARTALR